MGVIKLSAKIFF